MKAKRIDGVLMSCPCGSQASIFQSDWGYYGHCPHCGRMTFFKSETLLEKLQLGAKSICAHEIEFKNCKDGTKTGWCKICRVRVFVPAP